MTTRDSHIGSHCQHRLSDQVSANTIEALFVDLFLEAHQQPPKQIILDLDATDDPLHGHQEGRFFHGYYDCYCYLPLYIFVALAQEIEQHLQLGAAVAAGATGLCDPGSGPAPGSTSSSRRGDITGSPRA
jgi:hypothetical protein